MEPKPFEGKVGIVDIFKGCLVLPFALIGAALYFRLGSQILRKALRIEEERRFLGKGK